MHIESQALMHWVLDRFVATRSTRRQRAMQTVVDVGSFDVNGSYRTVLNDLAWRSVVGLDVREGPGVDQVIDPGQADWSSHGTFDLVISGNTMEHVLNPFVFMKQLATLLKPKAWVIVLAPWRWPIHYHPIDAWRILPDGMRAVFGAAGVHVVRMGTTDYENGNGDTWAVGANERTNEPDEVLKFVHRAQEGVQFVIRMDDQRKK